MDKKVKNIRVFWYRKRKSLTQFARFPGKI